jgi:hypothetical protein
MAIKPEAAFDVCWELYQRIQGEQESITVMDASFATGGVQSVGWRPVNVAEARDYALDFAIACKAALENSVPASRLVLFRLYYLGLAPYENARHFLGLSETSWEQWTWEIRKKAGAELMRRGLFPPRRYFGERSRPRRKK